MPSRKNKIELISEYRDSSDFADIYLENQQGVWFLCYHEMIPASRDAGFGGFDREKITPDYFENGVSLLWQDDRDGTGITIVKVLSCENEVLELPDEIDGRPVTEIFSFADLDIKELILPKHLKKLWTTAGCNGITEITVPASTQVIKCLPELNKLKSVTVEKGNLYYKSVKGVIKQKNRQKE